MANSYLEFSIALPIEDLEKAEKLITAWKAEIGEHEMDDNFFENYSGVDVLLTEGEIMVLSEEDGNGNPMAAAHFIQRYLDALDIMDKAVILTWAEYCDKLRPGEFSGGALVVSADRIEYIDLLLEAQKKAESMNLGEL